MPRLPHRPPRRTAVGALLVLVAAAVAAASAVPAAGAPHRAASAPRFSHLDPGGPARYAERVPVNLVFVGFEPGKHVQSGKFLAGLPQRYRPLVRSRLLYDIKDFLGIDYRYRYNVRFTDTAYENRFFQTLGRLATPAPLTDFQQQYNDQQRNVLDVTANHFIDAPTVERWLAFHPPRGVDTRQDTVFFVNWYGRKDFKFHVYTKTDEPDPDTGYNFGVQRQSRKIIAWGGTTPDDEENGLGKLRRVWFHDLSAGPESWTDNWNVDNADVDEDGVADFRLPPVWEYLTKGGFRPRSALSGDLAKVARYVAINLLFTSSPYYPPAITPPRLPRTINLDSNTYEGWAGVDASDAYIKPDLLIDELAELQPLQRYDYDEQELPFTGEARRCYELWLADESCVPETGLPGFANLFAFNAANLDRTRDDTGRVDYELPIFNYATPVELSAPFLGFADDNYVDGTQSFVFAFVDASIVELGYGLTTTLIHEVGHHVALSHPHDGYDYQDDVDYEDTGPFNFASSGDQSNSIMSYIDLNWDFSQFDRDNMNRFLAAAYTSNANRIAAAVLADPDAAKAHARLRAADRLLGAASSSFSGHRYLRASVLAAAAYREVVGAARIVGVPVASSKAGSTVAKPAAAARASATHLQAGAVDTLHPDSRRVRR
jgi:hypothetical protein